MNINTDRTFHIAILSGCLPNQQDIAPQDLFHQVLAANLQQQGVLTNIAAAWYESIDECEKHYQTLLLEKPNVLLLHLRPNVHLKMSKFRFSYIDETRRMRYSIQLPSLNKSKSYTITHQEERFGLKTVLAKKQAQRPFRALGRTLNYIAGVLYGNSTHSYLKLVEMTLKIAEECHKNGIQLIVVGPQSRPRSKTENYLLKILDNRLSRNKYMRALEYVSIYGVMDNEGNPLFNEDSIHLNKTGHRLIASLLLPKINIPHFNENPC